MDRNIWLDGIMGVIIGDALGLPVQFLSREELKENPVTKMMGYGTFHMPAGSWSDDGSLTLATLDSIREKKGIDYDDIMTRFVGWNFEGQYTPTGRAYDQGRACLESICNYACTGNYKTCGKTGEYANGNGALMRIMPVCLYAYTQFSESKITLDETMEYIHQATALTHNHLRAKIASGIYFFMVQSILSEDGSLIELLQKGIVNAETYYTKDISKFTEWTRYSRLFNLEEFSKENEDEIKSSGYVVDSIEAAVWSLITTGSYKEALLKAVNLGDDTDTVGAIAGGLAGLYYGYAQIPDDWKGAMIMKEELEAICDLSKEEME